MIKVILLPAVTDDRLKFYDSLNSYEDIEKLISDGEAEGSFLECKSPLSLTGFDKNLQSELAQELSGFSNTGGGIIIFGVSTNNKKGHDVLTQIEPIGLVKDLESKIKLKIPLLTEASISTKIKIIREKPTDTKGIVVLYIPGVEGDPIKNKLDGVFYIRAGEKTPEMPYELLKRMFIGSNAPNISAVLIPELIKRAEDGRWKIPIALDNKSNYPAKSTAVLVGFENYSSCEEITAESFRDISNLNPNTRKFSERLQEPVYRGLNVVVGSLFVKMKKNKKMVRLRVSIFSENMRAKYYLLRVYLLKSGKFKIKIEKEEYLY